MTASSALLTLSQSYRVCFHRGTRPPASTMIDAPFLRKALERVLDVVLVVVRDRVAVRLLVAAGDDRRDRQAGNTRASSCPSRPAPPRPGAHGDSAAPR